MRGKLMIIVLGLSAPPTITLAQVEEDLGGGWVGCYSVTPERSSDVEGLDFVPTGVVLRADTAVAPIEPPSRKEGPYPHTLVSPGEPTALLVAEVWSSAGELVDVRTVWLRAAGNAWVQIGWPGRLQASLFLGRAPTLPAAVYFSFGQGRSTQFPMDIARVECS